MISRESRKINHRRRTLGQAMVETAIVLPFYIFLFLGILQMAQVHHAQAMLKYAAYRAARAGTLKNMDKNAMLKEGLITMLPVDTLGGVLKTINSPTQLMMAKMLGVTEGALTYSMLMPGRKHTGGSGILFSFAAGEQMKVEICGPAKEWLSGKVVAAQNGSKGNGELDFDDPRNTYSSIDKVGSDSGMVGAKSGTQMFLRTKLKIQLKYQHRLIIPFVNAIIYDISHGVLAMRELRLNRVGFGDDIRMMIGKLNMAHILHIYTLPMYANYALRMQSNFLSNYSQLPDKDGGNCIAPEKSH